MVRNDLFFVSDFCVYACVRAHACIRTSVRTCVLIGICACVCVRYVCILFFCVIVNVNVPVFVRRLNVACGFWGAVFLGMRSPPYGFPSVL